METPTAPNNLPRLIVDTNVIANSLDKKTASETFRILTDLKKSYQLSISKVTLQELVAKGSKDVYNLMNGLDAYLKFEVDDKVLLFAGLMTCIGVKPGFDSTIASTAFLNSSHILTANHKDFPEPCFTEIECWTINYKNDNRRTEHYGIHLIRCDMTVTLKKINDNEYIKEIHDRRAS